MNCYDVGVMFVALNTEVGTVRRVNYAYQSSANTALAEVYDGVTVVHYCAGTVLV